MEISNNLLAALVIVAMAVSIAGTMSMISVLPGQPITLTGMQTQERSGIANVTLASEVHIELLVPVVEFGSIASTPGTTNNTADFSPHPFVLRNNGTLVANVSIGEANPGFGSGPLWDQDDTCESCFQFNSTPNGTSGAVAYYDWTDFSVANGAEADNAASLSTDPANLVWNLSTQSSGNQRDVTVHLNISVPTGESGGVKEATIFFYAEQA